MSRIGKIARLPKTVREELNCRLLDGEQQSRLVEWLNGREEVQAVVTAEFDGQPINEPNLTAWVQGGFEDWRRQQESRDAADRLVEETAAVADAIARQETGVGGQETRAGCLVDRVATMAALAMAEQLMAIRRMEDSPEKRRAVLKIVRGLVRLRKSERDCERAQREASSFAKASADKASMMGVHGREAPPSHVRARMAEVLAGMSDEEIVEILRAGGYMCPADPQGAEDGGRSTEDGERTRSTGLRANGHSTGSGPLAAFGTDLNGGEHPPSPGLPPSQGLRRTETADAGENDYEQEHEVTDIRARMAEVLELTSDEEIAEILHKGGGISAAQPFDKRRFVEAWAPDGTWWSEEDEAAYQAEEEAASRQAQAKRDVWSGTDGGLASAQTDAPDESGHPPSQGYGETSKAPPTVQPGRPEGGLIQP